MKKILLIYPFFLKKYDRSMFRFPPLGLAYIAAGLRRAGYDAAILDCTFLTREEALSTALNFSAEIVGIYGMITMREDALFFAEKLRKTAKLLVAGGPLPSVDPGLFFPAFDIVVKGEGERTMRELAAAYERGSGLYSVPGIVYPGGDGVVFSKARGFEKDLDAIDFPARDLLPNADYIRYGKKRYGYSITSIMSSRGCPYACDFCSNAVFGVSFRLRSVQNVADEVEAVLALGYDRIHFGDDVFTMEKERVLGFCDEIGRRGLKFKWECLGRVDTLDSETAAAMKLAGCEKIYFGIESGSEPVLRIMKKKITAAAADAAVRAAHKAGIKTGAFFMLFYPGDTNETVIETIRYAATLPLDYVSFTLPYPIQGTGLYEKLKNRNISEWRQKSSLFTGHTRIYDSEFSGVKMKFGLLKAALEFRVKKYFRGFIAEAFAQSTNFLLKVLR